MISEYLELIGDKVMHWAMIALEAAAVVIALAVIWKIAVYFITQNRVELVKGIYNSIQLGETPEKAVNLFRHYKGGKDQYAEEAILTNGKREVALCLLFSLGRGEMGEIRLTYVDNMLVQKQQNGIW